jgi:NADPH-dependent F420 reductase
MNDEITPTIGILGGTGNLGPGLAARLATAGYHVLIGSRQAEKAQRIAAEVNDRLGGDEVKGFQNAEVARSADLCVLTVNAAAHEPALRSLRDPLQGKLLIDATARVDFRNPKPPPPPSAPRIAQGILGPGVRVVGAFQTVPAHRMDADPEVPLDLDVLVCADDSRAAEETIELAESIGLRAYYAGALDNAIVVEGLTAILIDLNRRYRSAEGSVRIVGIQA